MPPTSSSVAPACANADVSTGIRLVMWTREAISGTTPPYSPWIAICDATRSARMRRPSSTSAAAVSSHDDSMPSVSTLLELREDGADLAGELALRRKLEVRLVGRARLGDVVLL